MAVVGGRLEAKMEKMLQKMEMGMKICTSFLEEKRGRREEAKN